MTIDQKVDHLLAALCYEWPERAIWLTEYVQQARDNKCEPLQVYAWLLRHTLRACMTGKWFPSPQGANPTQEFQHGKIEGCHHHDPALR